MICENCGKDSNSGIVYKKHIFCSQRCRDEYFKIKEESRKIKKSKQENKT